MSKLDQLNKAVENAIKARTKWMDDNMSKYAKYKIGEELYDLDSGRCLGTIDKYYRYHAGQNPIYDTSMDIHYQLKVPGPEGMNCYDNTSRMMGIYYGNKDDLKRHLELKLSGVS